MEPKTADSSKDPFASPSSSAASPAPGGIAVESHPKADLAKRFLALLIDSIIAAVVGVIPVVGGIAGAAYMVARDGLELDFMRQRSIGKQLMKLRPVRLDGAPMTLEASVRRNWMFGLGALVSLLVFIPILGWALIPFVGLISLGIGLYEVYLVLTDPQGRRWGDRLGGTVVVETAD